jgi:hypothetical protein
MLEIHFEICLFGLWVKLSKHFLLNLPKKVLSPSRLKIMAMPLTFGTTLRGSNEITNRDVYDQ